MTAVYDLIAKKRDGHVHSAFEIDELVDGFVAGRIPDYQIAAWLMAAYVRGLNRDETLALTRAMTASGETISLDGLPRPIVDKHSTGGVGDKTTLVIAPMVAACGLPVAKMSGRGLGHTGGTLDKLESIPGLTTTLSRERFVAQVARIGLAVAAQTESVVPADRLLYALRDVTATVDSLPLIASSIMCKKLATGADAIVLDVKTGSGAFMRDPEEAVALAETMVEIGEGAGKRMAALVTAMDGPLGLAIGNALEVQEALDTLAGRGPADLTAICLLLAGQMLALGGKAATREDGAALARLALDDGRALRAFQDMVAAQGGPERFDGSQLPHAAVVLDVVAVASGYVTRVDALALGLLSRDLGAGRATKTDVIAPAAGIVLRLPVGSMVARGDVLAQLHLERADRDGSFAARCGEAIDIGPDAPAPRPLVHAIVEGHAS